MGGGKRRIPMARIANLQARRVCFAKRRKGLFRKCLELCELSPGYEVAAVAFSPDVGNPFAFAGPSPSASPADIFRRFLSGLNSPPALLPRAGSEEGSPSVTIDGGLAVGCPAGRTVEFDDAAAHHGYVRGVPSSPSLDDGLTQTLLDEEERAELAAALQWADGVLKPGHVLPV